MKIQQAYVGVKFFKDVFLKKYGLKPYKDPYKPAVFFGLYQRQHHYLKNHKGFAVIVWAGSDAIHLKQTPDFVKYIKNRKDLFHIAISNFIENDLRELNIPFYSIPITPHTNDDIKPYRLGRYIFMYTSTNSQVYGEKYIPQIKRSLPGIKIILATKDTYNRKELIKVYQKCFLGLRLTKHDGLSNTVSELGLMGRRVVWNGNTPNAINYRTVSDIVKIIKNESNYMGKFTPKVATEVKEYLQFRDDWLDTDFYKDKKFPKKETIIKIKPAKKNDKCSVIINTYKDNLENLRWAIESYLTQKNIDVQLILSTVKGDNSIQLAKEYKEIDLCISEQPGIYPQLNKALTYIKHEWFAYASGNDEAYQTKLYDEISLCKKHKKLVCYSAFDITFDGIVRTRYFHNYSHKKHLEGNFISDCALIHKDLIKKYGPFKLEWGNYAFYDFWLRVYEGEGNVFVYNPEPTWNYIVSNNSLHIKRKKNPELTKKYESLKQKMIESHVGIRQ